MRRQERAAGEYGLCLCERKEKKNGLSVGLVAQLSRPITVSRASAAVVGLSFSRIEDINENLCSMKEPLRTYERKETETEQISGRLKGVEATC